MLVCTAKQMAAIDRDTIAGGVAGLTLMERAGAAMTGVTTAFLAELRLGFGSDQDCRSCDCDKDGSGPASGREGLVILCGKGNNGGDGLVMARLLAEAGEQVTVMLLAAPNGLSPSARANFDRLPPQVVVVQPERDQWLQICTELTAEAELVIDAIFGTGITPPLRDHHAGLIRCLNAAAVPVVAVDVPSGVAGDDGRVDPVAVAADLTITVGLPKLGLLLPPGRDFSGDLEVVDIGFAPELCRRHASDLHWLPAAEYLQLLPPRPTDTHKYQVGRLLIVAGSRRYGGAAHLAGMGGLRSGAGLVTLLVPLSLEIPLRTGLPEALVEAVAQTDTGTIAPLDQQYLAQVLAREQAVALGPGLDRNPQTDRWLVEVLEHLDQPVVLDADGLTAFTRMGREPQLHSQQAVLTPHPGELAQLTGLTTDQVQARRFDLAAELAVRWGVVLVLKGSPTLIGAPDGRVFINPTGDDALARGGSGDVLTGLIGGLLAQGLDALAAALLGCYVHGQAGTLAASAQGTRSVLVREIAAAVGPVLQDLAEQASLLAVIGESK